jgi:hypothetical protein
MLIEFPLPLVHTASILIRITANGERSDNVVIGTWLPVDSYALPDQKNLLGKALDIVAVFHNRTPSGNFLQRGLREFMFLHALLAHFLGFNGIDHLGCSIVEKMGLMCRFYG